MAGWGSDMGRGMYNTSDLSDQYGAQELVDSMANTMKLGGGNAFLGVTKTSPTSQLSPATSHAALNSGSFTTLTTFGGGGGGSGTLSRNGSDPYFQQAASIENNITLTSLNSLNGPRSPARLLGGDGLNGGAVFSLNSLSPSLSPSQSMDTLSAAPAGNASYHSPQRHVPVHAAKSAPQSRGTQGLPLTARSLLTARSFPGPALGVGATGSAPAAPGAYGGQLDTGALLRAMGPKLEASSPLGCSTPTTSSGTSLGSTASQVMGHLLSLNNPLPNDLDLNFDSLQGGLECDVDQVIRHELSVDGNLDFNFESIHGANTATSVSTSMASAAAAVAAASSRSWVH